MLTLTAIHGNGGGGFRFARLAGHLPKEIRFEAVTLPGFAGVPRDPALQTMGDYAAALRQASPTLTDEQRPKILLGTGIGGSFALEYARRYPADIDGLILHAPVGTRLDKRWFPRLMGLPGMTRLGQTLFSSRLIRPLWKKLLFVTPAAIPQDYLDRFFDEYRRCQVFGQMFELIDRAWWESLRPIDLPAALLWGERERVLTIDQLEDYKQLLPRHRVRTVPGWDHFPMIEQPAEYAREIVDLAQQLTAVS